MNSTLRSILDGRILRSRWGALFVFALGTIFFLAFCSVFSAAEEGNWGGGYLSWMQSYRLRGLVDGYYAIDDIYPPGVYTILALFSRIPGDNLYAFKLSQEIFFLASSLIVFFETKDCGATFLFQLSMFVSQIIFSSVDIYFVPFLVAALVLLKHEKYFFSAITFVCVVLIKWQPIFLSPFFLIYLARESRPNIVLRRWLPVLAGVALVLVCVFSEFGFKFVDKLFSAGANSATAYSAYAFNFGWLLSFFINNWHAKIAIIPPHSILLRVMQLSFSAIMLALLVKMSFVRGRLASFGGLVFVMTLGYANFLIFYPGINSNYWVVLPCLIVFLSNFKLARLALFYVAILSGVNVLYLRAFSSSDAVFLFGRGGEISVIFSLINVFFMMVALIILFNRSLSDSVDFQE